MSQPTGIILPGDNTDPRVELVQQALSGTRGADQQRIAQVGIEWLATILQKNTDYGSSAWQVPVFAPQLDPGTAMLVRMSDKVLRLQRLLQHGAALKAESFEDTLRDLAGYCLLYLSRPEEASAVKERMVPRGDTVTAYCSDCAKDTLQDVYILPSDPYPPYRVCRDCDLLEEFEEGL